MGMHLNCTHAPRMNPTPMRDTPELEQSPDVRQPGQECRQEQSKTRKPHHTRTRPESDSGSGSDSINAVRSAVHARSHCACRGSRTPEPGPNQTKPNSTLLQTQMKIAHLHLSRRSLHATYSSIVGPWPARDPQGWRRGVAWRQASGVSGWRRAAREWIPRVCAI